MPGCVEFCRPSNTGKPPVKPRRFISQIGNAGFCCGDSASSVADNGSSGRLTALSSSFLSSVKIWACSLPARQGNIGRPLVGRRERFAGHADEDLVHRNALAGMAGDDIAVASRWPKSRSMTQP